MNKPLEVKIDIDENGDLTTDPSTNTVYAVIHNDLTHTLRLLTYFDQNITTQFMEETLHNQLNNPSGNINRSLLNSVSWSIGSIYQILDDQIERRFLVEVIKTLLTLCEQAKGKDNKAICASNIMYVVGQYPRFMNKYFKFLKTVVKKLFEFMHEYHPGVRDFACETFMKIGQHCGNEFIISHAGDEDQEPFINVLIRDIDSNIKDLLNHHKLMFYEALGIIINHEKNPGRKIELIERLMASCYNSWLQIFNTAQSNIDVIKNNETAKHLELLVRINERVCVSTKGSYWNFGQRIFSNLINTILFYSDLISNSFANNQMIDQFTRAYMCFNRTAMKYLENLVDNMEDKAVISSFILQEVGKIIKKFTTSDIRAREPHLFLVLAKIIEKLKDSTSNYLVEIWQSMCAGINNFIGANYMDYPEYRINFFMLVKSMVDNTTKKIFSDKLPFIEDMMCQIIYEIKHSQNNIMDNGLLTMTTLFNEIVRIQEQEGVNMVNDFCRAYYFRVLNEIISVMTDSCHKGGFKRQVEILKFMILMIEKGIISEGVLGGANGNPQNNKQCVLNYLNSTFLERFNNLNKTQIEAIIINVYLIKFIKIILIILFFKEAI